MRNVMFILIIIMIITATPLILVYLLNKEIFSFASGEVDSWIMFWGSYIGAIIGASVVYFVARLQIKKQYEQQVELFKLENIQQIKAIEIENEHSTSREMKKFYLTNKLEKIEEMLELIEELSSINTSINNDLVHYVALKETLEEETIDKWIIEYKKRLSEIKNNYREHHSNTIIRTTRLIVLANYIEDSFIQVMDLQSSFAELFIELKKCYNSKDKYKEYINSEYTKIYTIDICDTINDQINKLSVSTLQNELKDIWKKIELYM